MSSRYILHVARHSLECRSFCCTRLHRLLVASDTSRTYYSTATTIYIFSLLPPSALRKLYQVHLLLLEARLVCRANHVIEITDGMSITYLSLLTLDRIGRIPGCIIASPSYARHPSCPHCRQSHTSGTSLKSSSPASA